MDINNHIGFIGGGNMASAIISGIINKGKMRLQLFELSCDFQQSCLIFRNL